jgi:hypothetical protein
MQWQHSPNQVLHEAQYQWNPQRSDGFTKHVDILESQLPIGFQDSATVLLQPAGSTKCKFTCCLQQVVAAAKSYLYASHMLDKCLVSCLLR